MRALEFITGRVIFKLRYNQIYQLKTTLVRWLLECQHEIQNLADFQFLLALCYFRYLKN